VFGAGGREGAVAVIVAEAVAGAGQVGEDESMIPPKYDPADELSLSYDTPALTLSHSTATNSGNEHMVVRTSLSTKSICPPAKLTYNQAFSVPYF
jgi:hypothetical protein